MTSHIDLSDHRVLLLGSSSGIGAAAARVLAACGARVCLHYNANRQGAETLAEEIARAGGAAEVVGGDLLVPGAIPGIVSSAVENLGGLDVLINNAGSLVGRTPLEAFDDDIWDRVTTLNVRAVLETARAAHPTLSRSAHAAIINVGSIAGRNGGAPGSGLYAAAKAAVHSLTRSMAKEFAKDAIRVNAVAPGFIATPFHAATPLDTQEAVRKTIPMGRLGTAEDCAWIFAFLASQEMSGYITGQIIDVNGGQFMP
ncbi:SDR family NAD(P)-dependent oxidoreductase [Roseixanthobacter pseudopolyaromaticivorans]|uniref:SDR family NAD(P)-dependent oxidoreductase n=1 Tax=Xanthobacteraceae TaxID=335928 RepID=UPI0037269625